MPTQAPQGQKTRSRGPRRVASRYGTQLREKQNLKEIFGIREEQLRRYYGNALHSKQETGPALIDLLERRLDNAVYRAGFAGTRSQARQMTTHRLFTVNGRPVDIPSYSLKKNDVVAVKESKRGKALFSNFQKRLQNVRTPAWITLEPDQYAFRVVASPDPNEAGLGVDIRAIVELFAR